MVMHRVLYSSQLNATLSVDHTSCIHSLLTLHPLPSLFQWQKQMGLILYPLWRIPQWLQGRDQ
jgi:hypothetical protein